MKRRTFIKKTSIVALSVSTVGGIHWNGQHFVGDNPTTTDILGPFYRPGAPLKSNLILPDSKGTPLVLHGVVLKQDGKTPIPNALVEIWHCDENEVYDNSSDEYKYRKNQKQMGSISSKPSFRYLIKQIRMMNLPGDPPTFICVFPCLLSKI